jgi:hypothetical protein
MNNDVSKVSIKIVMHEKNIENFYNNINAFRVINQQFQLWRDLTKQNFTLRTYSNTTKKKDCFFFQKFHNKTTTEQYFDFPLPIVTVTNSILLKQARISPKINNVLIVSRSKWKCNITNNTNKPVAPFLNALV